MNTLVLFHWGMKKILRGKENFGILEGFLSELLRRDIVIQHILESSDDEAVGEGECNRIDLLALADGSEPILVGLLVEDRRHYCDRTVSLGRKRTGNSLQHVACGEAPRAICVYIAFYDFGRGGDYIYKGGTEFCGMHNGDALKLLTSQKNSLQGIDCAAGRFSEYYIIRINGFGGLVRDTLDEWIHFLKSSEIRQEFTAKGLLEAKEELSVLRLSAEERRAYDRFIEDRRCAESSFQTAWLEGFDKGLEMTGFGRGDADDVSAG